jgi:hypothetical protein
MSQAVAQGRNLEQQARKRWHAMRIPTSSGIRLLKRYGFASKAEAKAAVDRVNELRGLAGPDDSMPARGSGT